MRSAFLSSVGLKGFGAVIELVIQVLLTRNIGVEGYGSYSVWINAADLIFWCCFSGIVKCNTYYLSHGNYSIKAFRRRYYYRYVIPVLFVAEIGFAVLKKPDYFAVGFITLFECLILDRSSILLAKRNYFVSLFGEYVLGRIVLLAGLLSLVLIKKISINAIVLVYIFQYVCVFLFLQLQVTRLNKTQKHTDISNTVSLKKWGAFQRADIAQSMITHMPVLLQHLFVGDLETGVVSLILIIKKVITFISGPTAKIFLPEFSRSYQEGRSDKLASSFLSIIRIQMLFIAPLSVLLIGFPEKLLSIFAKELSEYSKLFQLCSFIFLLTTSFGPCGGLMQMTNNEKWDNIFRDVSIGLMIMTFLIFRNNSLFTLYGLCIQVLTEVGLKFLFVCKWLGKAPISLIEYCVLCLPPILSILIVIIMRLQDSWLALFILTLLVLSIECLQLIRNENIAIKILAKKLNNK